MTTRLLIALASAAMLGHADAGEPWRVLTPADTAVTVTLSAGQSAYYIGEPIVLTLGFRNTSEVPLAGFFVPVRHKAQVHYRREGGAFAPLLPAPWRLEQEAREWRNFKRAPGLLKPGEETRTELKLVMDYPAQRFVLHEPGNYEFKVISHPAPRHPDDALASPVVAIRVEPVPSTERGAFAEYEKHYLGRVTSAAGYVAQNEPETVRTAVDFVERYPDSRYSEHVRKALVSALRARVVQGRATREQQRLLEKVDPARR
jgi:hypothetical protein